MYFWPRVWAAGPPLVSPRSWACGHSPRGADRTGIWSASLCRVTALRWGELSRERGSEDKGTHKPPPSLCTTGQAGVGSPLCRGDGRGRLLSSGHRLHHLAPVSSRAPLESGSSGHGGGQSETDVPTSAARLASCLPRNLGLAPSRKETLGLSRASEAASGVRGGGHEPQSPSRQ